MNIARAIRTCRLARRMSQAELAKRTDLSPSYLSLIESGKKEPALPTLRGIAEALDLSLDVLMLMAIDYKTVKLENGDVSDLFGQMLLALTSGVEESGSYS